MNKLIQTFVFLSLAGLFGCSSEDNQKNIELKVSGISISKIAPSDEKDSYEIIANFNRPLTESEIEPEWGPRYTYGVKYWIHTKTGWKREPWGIESIQRFFTRNNNKSYKITSESSHHPLRGYNAEVDKSFTPENINKIIIELYLQDKYDKDSTYKLLQRQEFTSWQ